MKGFLKTFSTLFVSFSIAFSIVTGVCYAGKDSAYDQAQGTARDSDMARQAAEKGDYESARSGAQRGFDIERSSNLGPGNLNVPEPKPAVDKDKQGNN